MCNLASTIHTPCQHPGSPSLRSPCAKGLFSGSKSGCNDSVTEGITYISSLCAACNYRSSLSIPESKSRITFRGLDGEVAGFRGILIAETNQKVQVSTIPIFPVTRSIPRGSKKKIKLGGILASISEFREVEEDEACYTADEGKYYSTILVNRDVGISVSTEDRHCFTTTEARKHLLQHTLVGENEDIQAESSSPISSKDSNSNELVATAVIIKHVTAVEIYITSPKPKNKFGTSYSLGKVESTSSLNPDDGEDRGEESEGEYVSRSSLSALGASLVNHELRTLAIFPPDPPTRQHKL
jgi:hypothetical protein